MFVRLTLVLILLGLPAVAQDFDALQRSGTHAFMRHALAPGTGDPPGFDVETCSTQRNLDDRGRQQARDIGAALRAAGVRFDEVWTSHWCRSRDTAVLMDLGPVTEVAALDSFFDARDRAEAQTRDLRARLAALPAGTRVMMVSHQVNIRALTGTSTRSGEIVVIDADGAIADSILIGP